MRLIRVAVLLVLAAAAARADPTEPEIGSTRNSRVARAFPPGKRPPLTYLAARDLAADELAALRKLAPNVKIVVGLDRTAAMAHAAEADAADARLVTPEFIARAPHLVWANAPSAGVDWLLA